MSVALLFLAGALNLSSPPNGQNPELPSCHAPGITPPQPATEPNQAMYYPPEAMRRNQQGTSLVGFDIDQSGKVVNTKLLQSSGYESIDNASLASTSARTYRPAISAGKAVACHNEFRIVWKLSGGDEPLVNMQQKSPADFPATAKAKGEQGITYVMVFIDENGNITNSAVVRSSGFGDLDAASLDRIYAAHQVEPARLGGKAVKSSVIIGFCWTLNNSAAH